MRLRLSELGAAPRVVSTGMPTAPLGSEALVDRLPPPSVSLTPRERQVLDCVMNGEANKAIARRLGISHRTVEIHRGRAMNKLEARSPAELICYVLRLGAAGCGKISRQSHPNAPLYTWRHVYGSLDRLNNVGRLLQKRSLRCCGELPLSPSDNRRVATCCRILSGKHERNSRSPNAAHSTG